MMLKIITFVILSSLLLLVMFGVGKPSDWGADKPSIYQMLSLLFLIEILFLFSVIRYQMLGKPILRLKTCVNKHLLVTGTFYAVAQAVIGSYRFQGAAAKNLSFFQSDFLLYRLYVGVCTWLTLLQIYNFIRCRTICDNGLSGPGVTVFWKDIDEYHWETRETLYFTCKNNLLLFRIKARIRWTVPRGLRDCIDKILCEKLSQAHGQDDTGGC